MKVTISPTRVLTFLGPLLAIAIQTPPPVMAAERCIQIQRQGNIETFVNVCNVCRTVSVVRARPGSGVPVNRTLNIQAGTAFPGPFRGPGRTRITSDRLCPSERGGTKNLLDQLNEPPTTQQACVTLEQNREFGVVLVNRCGQCKAVAIERWSGNDANRVRDYMEISPRKSQPVASKGFSQVGLLGEIDCQS